MRDVRVKRAVDEVCGICGGDLRADWYVDGRGDLHCDACGTIRGVLPDRGAAAGQLASTRPPEPRPAVGPGPR